MSKPNLLTKGVAQAGHMEWSDVSFTIGAEAANVINVAIQLKNGVGGNRSERTAVFASLSYFDGINFAARIDAPALVSAGLMDDICPPRTVFAAYNHLQGLKEIRVYPYNQHEGGQTDHTVEKLRFLKQLWQ